MRSSLVVVVLALVLLRTGAARAQDAAPAAEAEASAPLEMVRPIIDTSGALGDSEAGLSRRLHDHKDDAGVAVGVVILPTLGTSKLSEAAAAWDNAFVDGFARDAHAGQASVLVVIALTERKLQVKTGTDVELDNAIVTRLTSTAMKSFAQNDVAGGVATMVNGLIEATPRPVTHVNVGFVASSAASALFLLAAVVAIVRTVRRERAAAQTG